MVTVAVSFPGLNTKSYRARGKHWFKIFLSPKYGIKKPGNETATVTTTVTFFLPPEINYRYPYRYHFQEFLMVVTAVTGNYR